jgi:pectinesterase
MKHINLTLTILLAVSFFSHAQNYDFVVAKDGSGNFTTIQAAIDACKAFPDAPVRIFIKNGIYTEKVKVPACNTHLQLIGESSENTILSYGDFFSKIDRGRNSTFYTYTLIIEADDFRMENMTVENSAGPVGQAVALHVEGDRCSFVNCRFLGHQDTVYLAGQTSRNYLLNCYIEGTTDFIFGAATAFFDKCIIRSKSDSYITAASTPQGRKYGFVFFQCKLTADEKVKKVYLGRPWRDYAQTVFIECDLGSHIHPAGWANWDKTNRDKTAFYSEYNNTGPGADSSGRVAWSKQLTKKQVRIFSVEKVLAPHLPSPEPALKTWAR